jgi:hypothetical protein
MRFVRTPTTRWLVSVSVIFAVAILSTMGFAQIPNTQASNAVGKQHNLSVTVTSKRNTQVSGLQPDDVQLFVDGKITPINYFEVDSEPASIAILVSLKGAYKSDLIRSVPRNTAALVDALNEGNEYSVLNLRDKLSFDIKNTSDKQLVKSTVGSIDADLVSGSATVNDAIDFCFDNLLLARHKTKILIIVSDMVDKGSSIRANELVEKAKRNGILVYSLLPQSRVESYSVSGQALGAQLATVSGGYSQVASIDWKLTNISAIAASIINFRYRLGFSEPSRTKNIDKDHYAEISVKLAPRTDSGILKDSFVRTRNGLFFGKVLSK